MSRQDQWLGRVAIEMVPGSGKFQKIPDPFEKCSGGDVTASVTKYRPGGMAAERTLGGFKGVGDVTMARVYVYERDHDLARKLARLVGEAKMQVTRQPLNISGEPTKTPFIYTGFLSALNLPDSDSNSASANEFSLVMVCDGVLG